MTAISDSTETGSSGAGNGATLEIDDITGRVRDFLVESFLLGDDDGFRNDEALIDAGIIDSTGVMELVTFLEGSFGITVDDDEMVADNLDSVDRLAVFIHRKLGEAN